MSTSASTVSSRASRTTVGGADLSLRLQWRNVATLTFASRLAMEGVDLRTIQELGGWKSLTMVGRYSHLSPGHRQTAIERLATRKPEQTERAVAVGAE